jgi:hypothetical protein
MGATDLFKGHAIEKGIPDALFRIDTTEFLFFDRHLTEKGIKEHIITACSFIDLEISNDKYLYHLVAPTELDYLLTLNAYRT